jgi:hypothetical protein
MSAINARLSSPSGSTHPVVLQRRRRELLLLGLSGLIPLVLALLISVQVSHPSFLLLIALTAGALGVVYLVVSPRYEVTLVVVALYLGLLEGPAKLGSGAHESASVVRDVLIFSVSLGAILRLLVSRQRVKLPPLSAWVLAFVGLVLVEALNPKTNGILKALGGFRQQLEWVPFFFFGYVIMRSNERFRKLFLLLGVIAAVNGVVSTYQTRLSPGQLASWGPGYRELVFGTQEAGKNTGLGGRTYSSEGVARVRPPGLGTDAGFGGGVGVLALPATLALLAVGRMRRRWPVMILCMGALIAVATGLGRLQVVGAVFSIIAFATLSFSAGRRVTKPLMAVLAALAVALPVIAVLVSLEGSGTFSRYTSIAPANVASSKDKKTTSLTHIPGQLEAAPLGVGLGTVGAASGFGGKQTDVLEGHGVSSETEYNFVADELGLPGLLLWVALTMRLLVLVLRRLRRVADIELRIYLAAVFATFIAFTLMGFSGPTMSSAAFGPYFWFTVGIAAYWFAGPGRRAHAPIREGAR